MKLKKLEPLIISILIPLAVGVLSSLLGNANNLMYQQLIKPKLSPPAFLFPIVWTILYILMGISAYLISSSNHPKKKEALNIYYLQLFFNFFWSIFFFRFGWYLFAFVWLIAMIVLIVRMILAFKQISPIAAYLQIPYLLWAIFAAYLNFMIYYLNR